jgi:hypothetical protein
MGRTFLDIDMARAADLLGMERKQADAIRDLARGEFLALGPAISRRPISIRIGAVRTEAKSASPKLMPMPAISDAGLRDALFAAGEEPAPAPIPDTPPATPLHELLNTIASPAPAPVPSLPPLDEDEQAAVLQSAIADVANEAAGQPLSVLYQDFAVRCRMRGVTIGMPIETFRQRLAMARAGIDDGDGWDDVMTLAASLPNEMLAPFLGLARAARAGEVCPSDDALAALYGTVSPGRARRMLAFIEKEGLIVCRTDLGGRRSVSLPHLGWSTAAAQAASVS